MQHAQLPSRRTMLEGCGKACQVDRAAPLLHRRRCRRDLLGVRLRLSNSCGMSLSSSLSCERVVDSLGAAARRSRSALATSALTRAEGPATFGSRAPLSSRSAAQRAPGCRGGHVLIELRHACRHGRGCRRRCNRRRDRTFDMHHAQPPLACVRLSVGLSVSVSVKRSVRWNARWNARWRLGVKVTMRSEERLGRCEAHGRVTDSCWRCRGATALT